LSGKIPSRRPQKRTLTFQKHLDANAIDPLKFFEYIFSCNLFGCVEESIGSFMYIQTGFDSLSAYLAE
ncbi:unnamed protein product, partial [Brassica rapa]